MDNNFQRLRRLPPPELDIRVRKAVKIFRLRRRIFSYTLPVVLIFFVAGLGLFLERNAKNLNVNYVSEWGKTEEAICSGFVPVTVDLKYEGLYSYTIYVNGETVAQGISEDKIIDSLIISDPFNYVQLDIRDEIYGGEESLTWVVYNF